MIKTIRFALTVIKLCLLIIIAVHCKYDPPTKDHFNVVFMTDIHLNNDSAIIVKFKKLLRQADDVHPDFILTGGDLISDALAAPETRVDSLFDLYIGIMKINGVPVYNTMGNHEYFGLYTQSGVKSNNPLFGNKMYERKIGPLYYSFMHNGWRFFIIDGIKPIKRKGYEGFVNEIQLAWLDSVLAKTDSLTPLVLVTHIPFLTISTQYKSGSMECNDKSLVIQNSREVLDKFKKHNLKLVLQGHLHSLECNYINGICFLVGGSASGAWWNGPTDLGTRSGFVQLRFFADSFEWKYVELK